MESDIAYLNMELLNEQYPTLTKHRIMAVWTYNTFYAKEAWFDSAIRSIPFDQPGWYTLQDEEHGITFHGICFDLLEYEHHDYRLIKKRALKIIRAHSKIRRGAAIRVYHSNEVQFYRKRFIPRFHPFRWLKAYR